MEKYIGLVIKVEYGHQIDFENDYHLQFDRPFTVLEQRFGRNLRF